MKIGGLQKLTLVDYPKKVATTIFLSGCNFKCPFCYSSELVLPDKIKEHPSLSEKEVFEFLKSREDLLDGVVICGGEPTLNSDLPKLVKKIKKMGFSVKLDTNGSNPDMLSGLINKKLIDYVAMDVKAPLERYQEVVGKRIPVTKIKKSVSILKEDKIDYEFRTTVVPKLIEKKDVVEIAKWISPAKKYYIQNFRAEKTIDPNFEKVKPYSDEYMLSIVKAVSPFFETCILRG